MSNFPDDFNDALFNATIGSREGEEEKNNRARDYKADRTRLEALLDERLFHRNPALSGVGKMLADCFQSTDINEQLRALAELKDNA